MAITPDGRTIPTWLIAGLSERLADPPMPQDEVVEWVNTHSVEDVLNEWLAWRGITGYTGYILDVLRMKGHDV